MEQSISECQTSIQQLKVALDSLLQTSTTEYTVSQPPSDNPVTINLCVEDNPTSFSLSKSFVYQISKDLLKVERSFAQFQNSINSSAVQSISLEENLALLNDSLEEIKSQLTIISERTKVSSFLNL